MTNRILTSVRLLLGVLGVVVLAGCGGGGNSVANVSIAQTNQVSGVIVDDAIQGALVKLIDRTTGQPAAICPNLTEQLCVNNSELTRTRENGYFTFFVDRSADLSNLVVVAEEGIDTVTGFDMSGITLRADLQLFNGSTRDLIVSPLTTLLSATPPSPLNDPSVDSGPKPPAFSSPAELASWLQLVNGYDLLADPQQSVELEQVCRLLVKLSKNVAVDDPVPFIAADPAPLLVDGLPNPQLLLDLGLSDAQQLDIADYFSAADPRREELRQTILQVLEAVGADNQYPTVVDPLDPLMRTNAGQLADALIAAAELSPTIRPLPANGHLAELMVRYALSNYGTVAQPLQDPATFQLDGALFAGLLQVGQHGEVALAASPQVAALIDLTQPISVMIPLPMAELPGNDNSKRVAYYLQSDASHLYQAQQLVRQVADDEVTDAIQVEVAAGLAKGGLYAEAENLLEQQVFQSQYRGDGYRRLGESATVQGDLVAALAYLQRAEEYYRRVAEAGGFGSFTSQDGINFKELAKAYRLAGDPVGAFAILSYLNDNFAPVITSAITYGQIFAVAKDLGFEFLQNGDLSNAAVVAEIAAPLATGTPSDGTSEQSRVISLESVAELFAALGDHDRTWSIYLEIAALRSGNSSTESRTVSVMDDMAVTLYQVGEIAEAFALADSLPGGSFRLDQMRAIKRLATAIALEQGPGTIDPAQPADLADYSALDVVAYLVGPDLFNNETDSQIEALTYFNSASAFIAKSLIDAGRYAEAEVALQQALVLIDTLDDYAQKPVLKASSKIDYGLVKVAGLYRLMGDMATADNLMQQAEQVLARISDDPVIYPKAIIAVAEEYLQQGRLSDAQRILTLVGEVLVVSDYESLVAALTDVGDDAGVLTYLPDYAALTRDLYNDATPAADHDKQLKAEVRNFVKIAGYYRTLGQPQAARGILDEAYVSATGIFVEDDRIDWQIEVVAAYAELGEIELASALADGLPYQRRRNEAKFEIAKALAARDDFPDDPAISIDTDHDGLPDFWWPQLGPPVGISLDNDSDGDGIDDVLDQRPLYQDLMAL